MRTHPTRRRSALVPVVAALALVAAACGGDDDAALDETPPESPAPDDTPDTLAARVQRAEHRLYPEVVRRVCSGEIQWSGRILQGDGRPLEAPLQLDEDTHERSGPEDRS